MAIDDAVEPVGGQHHRNDATASVRDANKGVDDCVAEVAVRGSKEHTKTYYPTPWNGHVVRGSTHSTM